MEAEDRLEKHYDLCSQAICMHILSLSRKNPPPLDPAYPYVSPLGHVLIRLYRHVKSDAAKKNLFEKFMKLTRNVTPAQCLTSGTT